MPGTDVDRLIESLAAIAASPTDNFLELVRAAKLEPAHDFVGADLSGMDLSDLDLTDFDFTGAELSKANLKGSLLRRRFLKGANLDRSLVRLIEDMDTSVLTQGSLPLEWRTGEKSLDMFLGTYRVQRYALERIALLIKVVQDGANSETIERIFEIASRKEKSAQVRRFIQNWRNNWFDSTKMTLLGITMDIAIRGVHPLSRPTLIHAIGRHVNLTNEVCDYFRRRLRRTRSTKSVQAIETILRSQLDPGDT